MDAFHSPSHIRRLLLPLTAGFCAVALVSGCSGAAPASPKTGPTASPSTAQAAGDLQSEYQAVIKNVLPSVVQIETSSGLGSGVVYDAKGHIVTNAHVVGSDTTFKVTVATGEKVLKASLVASYPEQDLAVLKLDTPRTG